MLFKLLNPINIIKLLSLLIKKNLDFIKDEYLDRKFYNINYLVKQLFIFDEKIPIFICGMPRSGTTLAQQIIASHNKVVGAGELTYLEQIIKKLFFEDGKLSLKKIKDSFKSKENILNNEYFKLLNFHGYDKSIIIDKAPANFFWIGFINYFFPNCKIVHCYRNAEDNLLSIFKNYFPSKNMAWSSNLENTVEKVKQFVVIYCGSLG